MLSRLLGIFLLLSANLAVAACPPPPAQPSKEEVQQAARRAQDHGFLWRISKDGRDSYLYGTIHVAKFDWMFPGPQVMRAIMGADIVALELDLSDADIRKRMAAGMATPPAIPLPEALVQRMRKQAEASCVPYESISALSGEMQVMLLTVMEGRLDGLEAAYAVDAVLAGVGHGAKKSVVSLETPESQMTVLKPKDEAELVAFVEIGLGEMEQGKSRRLLKRMATVWAESDYAELGRYEEWCECLGTAVERELMNKLLDGRNPQMAERIDELHKSGKKVFAAVGSLHMFGTTALPSLMQQRGYRVERVEFDHH